MTRTSRTTIEWPNAPYAARTSSGSSSSSSQSKRRAPSPLGRCCASTNRLFRVPPTARRPLLAAPNPCSPVCAEHILDCAAVAAWRSSKIFNEGQKRGRDFVINFNKTKLMISGRVATAVGGLALIKDRARSHQVKIRGRARGTMMGGEQGAQQQAHRYIRRSTPTPRSPTTRTRRTGPTSARPTPRRARRAA